MFYTFLIFFDRKIYLKPLLLTFCIFYHVQKQSLKSCDIRFKKISFSRVLKMYKSFLHLLSLLLRFKVFSKLLLPFRIPSPHKKCLKMEFQLNISENWFILQFIEVFLDIIFQQKENLLIMISNTTGRLFKIHSNAFLQKKICFSLCREFYIDVWSL